MAKIYDVVLAKVKIRDIIDYYGIAINGNKIICPFHDDSNPSMVINDEKNIVKCFACGEGANPISFIYKYETKINKRDITYNEAVKMASEIAHLNIDTSILHKQSEDYQYRIDGKTYNEDQKQLLSAIKVANEFFSYQLLTQTSKPANDYLEKRGISKEMAKEMNFGYVGKDYLTRFVSKHPKLDTALFEQLGLLRRDENGSYHDVFENRLMIPIKDEKGNVIAFSGRSLKGQEPKYLHSHETIVFKKMDHLYNFQNAKNNVYSEEIYIVEGFMDVAGSHRMGIDNVVALMGTELSDRQIKSLKKCNCDIILALDNDQAGKKAMLKHIPNLLKQNLNVFVVDIEKLGHYKDFGDVGMNRQQKIIVEKVKVPAFTFLLDKQYFANRDFTVQNLCKVYQQLRADKMLVNTLDESKLKEYIASFTEFKKEELEDIFHPKEILGKEHTPLESFNIELLQQHIIKGVEDFINRRDDKVTSSFYRENTQDLNEKLVHKFLQDSKIYLLNDNKINYAMLLLDILKGNTDFEKHELLNRFQHESVFERSFNENKERLNLTFEQKELIIHQYDNTLQEHEKLNLEQANDLFIINHPEDVDKILPDIVDPILKETIKEHLMIHDGMQYFKFGSVFKAEMLPYLSEEYLTKDRKNFKTILFFNNLNKRLILTNENIVQKNEPVLEKSENERSIERTFKHEKNSNLKKTILENMPKLKVMNPVNKKRILISREQVYKGTDKGIYFSTKEKDVILFAPKNICQWRDEECTHLVILPLQKMLSSKTMLSKYIKRDDEIHYVDKIESGELKNLTKVLEPQKNKENIVHFDFDKSYIQDCSGFVHLAAYFNNQVGYIKINSSNFIKEDKSSLTLEGKPYFEFSFYDDYDNFIGKVNIQDIPVCTQDFIDHGFVQKVKESVVIKKSIAVKDTKMEKKDFLFSIHKSIIVSEYETSTSYFVRVPNTAAKQYIYLPKDTCTWTANKEMLFSSLKQNEQYQIYDRYGKATEEWSFDELKSKWEEKSKNSNMKSHSYYKKQIMDFDKEVI